MTPYGGLTFFVVLAALLLPAVILGLLGRRIHYYGLFATLALLWLSFDSWESKALLAGFWLWETALCYGLLRLRAKGPSRGLFWTAVVLVIAPMVVSKVSGLLPGFSFSLLGISYMTFRALDVALDICDGRVKTLSLWETAYFILFAPAISSGPLDRYRRFTADLHRTIPREEYLTLVRDGVWRLMTGALYYFVFGSLIWKAASWAGPGISTAIPSLCSSTSPATAAWPWARRISWGFGCRTTSTGPSWRRI